LSEVRSAFERRGERQDVRQRIGVLLAGAVCAAMVACGSGQKGAAVKALQADQVFQASLADVRLGDGVPLGFNVTVRWRVEDRREFLKQFPTAERYGDLVMKARTKEAANRVANTYPSVDAVFRGDRERFVQDVRAAVAGRLADRGIVIREVILSDVAFPQKFTDAMEQIALKDRELESIKEKGVVDVANAKAEEQKAEAEGQVAVKKAEIEAKVAEINAKTEEKRRASLLAKAETEAQITERNAKAEAVKRRLLAGAEADRERDLAKARLEEQKSLKDLEVQKQRDLDVAALDKDKASAQLCAANPSYASFLINRELASKVQIAVLPVGSDANYLGGLLQNMAMKDGQRAGR
jgi:regulator of protease activity HflC (stomatin/prohibitin superfamily)